MRIVSTLNGLGVPTSSCPVPKKKQVQEKRSRKVASFLWEVTQGRVSALHNNSRLNAAIGGRVAGAEEKSLCNAPIQKNEHSGSDKKPYVVLKKYTRSHKTMECRLCESQG